MPNHITNIVHADPAVISDFRKDGKIDFNNVIPMPECLADFQPHSGVVDRAKAALGLFSKEDNMLSRLSLSNEINTICDPVKEDDIPAVVQAIQCFAKTGHVYWYDWATANWDTKWNAYGQDEAANTSNQAVFQTAWSMPEKVAIALSRKYPGHYIEWIYADEDLGSNCGTIALKGGEIIERNIAGTWQEMSEEQRAHWTGFAFKVCHPDGDPKEWGFDENWKSVEE